MDRTGVIEVGRVRARIARGGTTVSPATARLRLTQVLATADFRPAAIPPSAVLIVRRLSNSSPRPLALGPPGGQLDGDWERSIRASLAACYRKAARPIRETVGSDAPAVLFADVAELLICFARDVGAGETQARWWWRTLRRGLPADPAAALTVLLCREATVVPAVLTALADRDEVVAVVARLSPTQSAAILSATERAHGLPPLRPTFGDAGPPASSVVGAPPSTIEERNAPPWRDWVSPRGLPPELSKERACLIGVGVGLRRAPRVVRDPSFARALSSWWRTATVSPAIAPAVPPNRPRLPVPPPAGPAPSSIAHRIERAEHDGLPTLADRSHRVTTPIAGQRVSPEARGTVSSSLADLGEGVETEIGGVLFLINAMVRLDMPACFEADWRLASRVGPFALLEILGRALLGLEWGSDPIWAVLATLDDRSPDDPPAPFGDDARFERLPIAWSVDNDERPPQPVAPLPDPWFARLDPGLRHWAALVVPYVRWFLCRCLGLDVTEMDELADALLRRSGRVYVTAAHLDLVLRLDDISLPVRIAGLDRDPGWLPKWGRVVRYHFEG